MATTPTSNPIPSEAPQDLKFNAGKIDEFVTSKEWTYTDRFGIKRYTIEGINYLSQQLMNAFGYVTLQGVTFTTGATVASPNEVLFNTADNSYYKWSGSFASGAKVVPANSTPQSSGGVGPGKWLNVGDSSLRSDLASSGKAALVGFNNETVQTALDRHNENISVIQSVDSRSAIPINEYSGNKHWSPLLPDGAQLANYVFKTPTHVDFQYSSDPKNAATGVLLKFGRDDLSGSSAFWSQDSYGVRNLTVVGGTPEVATFEPWTSHTTVIENNRIMNNGASGKWAFNFKAQNWWPIVRFNDFFDWQDKKGSLVKAVDDEGVPADKYTGNSRIIVFQNRCSWGGVEKGGVMSQTSAVCSWITQNASQNSSVAVKLFYPSTFAKVEDLYTEMNFGNQSSIQIGDDVAGPSNVISEVRINGLFANMHANSTNKVISVGNSQTLINGLDIDRVFISNQPSSGFIPPIVSLNDLDSQKIIAGRIVADDMALIPLTSKHVSVIDKYNSNIPAINGDLVYSDASKPIPANGSTSVATAWFARSTAATTFNRSGSGNPSKNLRMSRYTGSILSPAGATTSIFYQLPRADLLDGQVITVQCLVNTSTTQNMSMNIFVYNTDGLRTLVGSKSFQGFPSWQEVTKTVAVSNVTTSNSFVVVEVGGTTTTSTTINVTGFRFNRGAFGLCFDANSYSYAEVLRQKDDYPFITP